MDPEQRRTSGHYHTIERVFTISQAARWSGSSPYARCIVFCLPRSARMA